VRQVKTSETAARAMAVVKHAVAVAMKGSAEFRKRPPQGGFNIPHEKEFRLLLHVLAVAPPGDPKRICEAIEDFGRQQTVQPPVDCSNSVDSSGQWLKVAGAEKATILAQAVQRAPAYGGGQTILEVGTYCGYSALRLLLAAGGDARLLTLEADPGNAVIASVIIAYAGVADRINVRTGHSEDLLPALALGNSELFCHGEAPFDLVFFDQRGSRYAEDFTVLAQVGAFADGAVLLADNVLKPGAPRFLWQVLHSNNYETEIIPVQEYAMPGAEDWMTLTVCKKHAASTGNLKAATGHLPSMPPLLARLEWEADQIRWQAERRPGVTFQRWADFAARMKHALASVGVAPAVCTVRHF